MEEEQIAEIAGRYSRLQLHRPDSVPNELSVQRGDTLIILNLEESRLRSYQITWTSGFTRRSARPEVSLCEK